LNRADVKQPPKKYPKLEDGGMMAKGGEFPISNSTMIGKIVTIKLPTELEPFKDKVVEEYSDSIMGKKGFWNKKYIVKKSEYGGYMAMGGIMEHGLEVGDNIYDADNENNLIFVENDSVDYEVNLSTGKRYRMGHSNERQDNYMAKGGKLYVKSYADDRREKALHGGKRISDEGNVYYENRLNHADVDRRVRLEDGGDIGSIKSNMHRYDK
jgi:hypothetical protein